MKVSISLGFVWNGEEKEENILGFGECSVQMMGSMYICTHSFTVSSVEGYEQIVFRVSGSSCWRSSVRVARDV